MDIQVVLMLPQSLHPILEGFSSAIVKVSLMYPSAVSFVLLVNGSLNLSQPGPHCHILACMTQDC